jgi:transmembrane sensor
MAMTHDPNRRDAALDWLVRTNDPEFDGWDEFTDWLQADRANADAYHELACSEAELLPFVRAVPERRGRIRHLWRPGAAIAASIAVVASAAALIAPRLAPAPFSTAPGQVRTIPLGSEDRLVMNGGTALELGGLSRRHIRLKQGQILVDLRGSASGTEVESGDLTVVDVGTIFEVSRDGNRSRVAVAEGRVIADPDGARLRLGPGEVLDTRDGAATLRSRTADPSAVGSFARGQLIYTDERLERVIADLRRSTGIDLRVSDAIRTRRFSGTLAIAEVRRDPRSLAGLLGVSMKHSGEQWVLEEGRPD